VGDATGAGVSCSNRLRFSFLTPPDTNRIYLARIHVDGRYVEGAADFDCVTNLQEVVAGGGFVDLPPLVQVPDGTCYGTCDIASRFLDAEPGHCLLRLATLEDRAIVLMATAQLGTHIIDDLETSTNLASGTEWIVLRSYTNDVSPDVAHFDAGWKEVPRDFDPSLLAPSQARFFRLKRTWAYP
jgi:hypothetical protein